MAGEIPDARARVQDEVAAARRAAMLRFAIQQQEAKHHAVALDMYRQLIEECPGTEEENEARERMLDLACLFGSEKQSHRMLSLYDTLESLYAPTSTEHTAEARRARVKQILDGIHEQERREAETQARLEAIREGAVPLSESEPVTMPPRGKEPARVPRSRATRRQEGGDVA
jgi:hypothetical protein